jgi:hypothetical protein
VLDSDMLLRRPFLPSDFNLSRGWAVGAKYDYMIGGFVGRCDGSGGWGG